MLYQLSYAGIYKKLACHPWRRIGPKFITGLAIRGEALSGTRVHRTLVNSRLAQLSYAGKTGRGFYRSVRKTATWIER